MGVLLILGWYAETQRRLDFVHALEAEGLPRREAKRVLDDSLVWESVPLLLDCADPRALSARLASCGCAVRALGPDDDPALTVGRVRAALHAAVAHRTARAELEAAVREVAPELAPF